MKLELPPDLEAIVEDAVRSGRYETPLEAAREALLLLDEHEAKFRALRREIEIGIASPKAPLEESFAEDVKRRGRARMAQQRSAG